MLSIKRNIFYLLLFVALGAHSASNDSKNLYYSYATCGYVDMDSRDEYVFYHFSSYVFDWPNGHEDNKQRAQMAKEKVLSEFQNLGMNSSKLNCNSGQWGSKHGKDKAYAERKSLEYFDRKVKGLNKQSDMYKKQGKRVKTGSYRFTF